MLLPTKGISAERALITIGAQILSRLDTPTSVSGAWERYNERVRSLTAPERVTFDWFSLALATLFAINAIDWTSDDRLRRCDVPS